MSGHAELMRHHARASAEVWLCWFPVPTRSDHDGGAVVSALRAVYRDVEDLLAERGITVEHVTVYRWVQRFTPVLIDAARPLPARPGRSVV